MVKRCCLCREDKPVSEYGRDKSRKDGLAPRCKPCAKQVYTEWRAANPEKAREQGRKRQEAYAERHPGRVNEAVREYQQRHPERVKSSRKNWRKNNLDKAREGQNSRSENYRKHNKPAIASRAAKRRAGLAQRACLLKPEDEAKIKALYGFAQYLTEKFGQPYHVDHIVPLHGETCSGLHHPDNLRVVPAQLNLSKGNKIDYELVPHAFRPDET